MELFSFSIKKFLILSNISEKENYKKSFYISGNRNPQDLLIFQKIELLNPCSKNKKNPP